jgi:hypothetical protein
MYNTIKKYTENLPIFLIAFLFIAQSELKQHAVRTSFNMIMAISCNVIFYFIFLKYPRSRYLAFMIALFVWFIMVYVKTSYIQ